MTSFVAVGLMLTDRRTGVLRRHYDSGDHIISGSVAAFSVSRATVTRTLRQQFAAAYRYFGR